MSRARFHAMWLGAALWTMAGCEAGSRAVMGGSLAKGRLWAEAEARVLGLDRAGAPGCEARVIASVRLLERPEAAATDYDRMYSVGLPDVSRGVQTPSVRPSSSSTVTEGFTERWTVDRCGERVGYRVKFSSGEVVEVTPEIQPRKPRKP